jgi:hypothetical protein
MWCRETTGNRPWLWSLAAAVWIHFDVPTTAGRKNMLQGDASEECFALHRLFFLHWRVLPAIEHVPFLTFMTYFIIAVFTEYVYFILFTELYIFAKIGRSGIKEFWSTTIYLYRYWYTRKHIIYRYTTIIYMDLEPGDARWTAQWADPADGAWRIHGVHGDLRILG